MKKSRYLRVLEREEVRGDDPSNAFFPPGRKHFLSHRGGDGN